MNKMTEGSYITAAATTAGVLAGAYCAYHLYNECKAPKLPTTWTKVGTLEEMFMYPVKSCAAVQRTSAECTSLGLKDGWLGDRTLMVVDEKNIFVTARSFPKLVLVQPIVNNSTLTLQCKDMEPLDLNIEEIIDFQTPKEVMVGFTPYPAYDCGWEANLWISRYLTNSLTSHRLVVFKEPKNKILNFRKFTRAFADEVPFNLINKASVDDLKTRVNGVQVTHKNFRTNFLLSGAQPYDEDNWKYVKIGESIFEVTNPCARCIMTANDPETGVRNANYEPLMTLRRYRQMTDPKLRRNAGNAPRMGLQMVLRSNNGSRVSINDPIFISS